MLEAHVAQLRREQKYDDGIVDVKGSEISIIGQPQVCSPLGFKHSLSSLRGSHSMCEDLLCDRISHPNL